MWSSMHDARAVNVVRSNLVFSLHWKVEFLALNDPSKVQYTVITEKTIWGTHFV
jgi:hypothetical protein